MSECVSVVYLVSNVCGDWLVFSFYVAFGNEVFVCCYYGVCDDFVYLVWVLCVCDVVCECGFYVLCEFRPVCLFVVCVCFVCVLLYVFWFEGNGGEDG